MKKILGLFMVLLFLAGCSAETPQSTESLSSSDVLESSVEPEESEEEQMPIDIQQLKSGDDVSIVGQRANSTLVNENTIWVQVQQPDKTFIIYHCQLKDEFIDKVEDLKLGTVVKVKGQFLSLTEFEQENTSPLITLYDCEIVE